MMMMKTWTSLCGGAQMAHFLRKFCVLYFQRAAFGTFKTCILNSHKGHIMCGRMADMQSATAENRRGEKKEDWYQIILLDDRGKCVCEQLAQGRRYLTPKRPWVQLATFCVASQRLNHYTTMQATRPLGHYVMDIL